MDPLFNGRTAEPAVSVSGLSVFDGQPPPKIPRADNDRQDGVPTFSSQTFICKSIFDVSKDTMLAPMYSKVKLLMLSVAIIVIVLLKID